MTRFIFTLRVIAVVLLLTSFALMAWYIHGPRILKLNPILMDRDWYWMVDFAQILAAIGGAAWIWTMIVNYRRTCAGVTAAGWSQLHPVRGSPGWSGIQ